MPRRIALSMIALPLVLATVVAATAQTTTPPGQAARPDTPATAPQTGPASGTSPGNEGSTGWTGGTGGSFTGTSNHAPTPGSPSDQPATVQGVNPQPSGNPATAPR
jgi:hypothetical protein